MKVKTNVKAGANGNGNGGSSSQINIFGIGNVGVNNGEAIGILVFGD
jgi:hypothetical protein